MHFGTSDMMFLAAMAAIMYFMFFLPQKKKQQALQKMLSELKKGDRVLTNSGMYGEVFAVKDNVITLKFHDNVRIDFDKSAISQPLTAKRDEKAVAEA